MQNIHIQRNTFLAKSAITDTDQYNNRQNNQKTQRTQRLHLKFIHLYSTTMTNPVNQKYR
jgi:hypothetical protein